MQIIYKYTLEPLTEQEIKIPEGVGRVIKFISANSQNDMIVVYAILDTSLKSYGPETFKFYVMPTGKEDFIELHKCTFLGTVKLSNLRVNISPSSRDMYVQDCHPLMFHVFYTNIG